MTIKNTAIIGFIALFGIGLFLIFLNLLSQEMPQPEVALNSTQTVSKTSTETTTSATPVTSTNSSTLKATSISTETIPLPSNTNASGYKDGTYLARADYDVPEGTENVKVSLTLKDGIITNLNNQNSSSDRKSASYQSAFQSQIQGKVVGKKISDLNLSRVSGASLTTEGFMNAIIEIKSQAKN